MASQQTNTEGIRKSYSAATNLETLLSILVPGTLFVALFIMTYRSLLSIPEFEHIVTVVLVFTPFFMGFAIYSVYIVQREIAIRVASARGWFLGYRMKLARKIYGDCLDKLEDQAKRETMKNKFPTIRVYRMYLETLENGGSKRYIKSETAFITAGYETGLLLIGFFLVFSFLDWLLEFSHASFQLEPSISYVSAVLVSVVVGLGLCFASSIRARRLDVFETANLALNSEHFEEVANELIKAQNEYGFLD